MPSNNSLANDFDFELPSAEESPRPLKKHKYASRAQLDKAVKENLKPAQALQSNNSLANDFDFELSSAEESPRPLKKHKYASRAQLDKAVKENLKPAQAPQSKPKPTAPKTTKKNNIPKFTKPAIEMLIKHCERIAFDTLQIQAELVKAELKTEKLRMVAAKLENDTVTKRLEVLRLEAELP